MSYKRLDPEDISISAESVVAPLFSNGEKYLTSFFTSSNQAASSNGRFYFNVFHQDPNPGSANQTTALSQFSVAYGHKTGLGAAPYNSGEVGKSPTSTIYGQYRNLVFGDEDTDFTFGSIAQDDFYVLSFDRARYKEKLLPGSFNLKLQTDIGGNTKVLHLTDNSKDVTSISFVDAGRVFEIVSGSDGSAFTGVNNNGFTTSQGSYGKFLPDVGVAILNASALDIDGTEGLNLGTEVTTAGTEENNKKVFDAIATGASGSLQSEETVSSNFVFVRVRNSEFNYSTNPSNITGSGELRHDVMINSPQAYITTVGLYNDNNDLLAIAKLSRPLLKDFTKEALIRIKLDY